MVSRATVSYWVPLIIILLFHIIPWDVYFASFVWQMYNLISLRKDQIYVHVGAMNHLIIIDDDIMAPSPIKNYWKAMLSRTAVNRGFSTTAPKMKTLASPKPIKGEMVPLYMTAILVVIVFAIAGHTAKQQMVHAPSVHFNKKRRGTMPEVELPDSVASNGEKFISKSFLRKVAHLKDREDVISNPIEGDLIKSSKNIESVKSVGVSPKGH